MYSMIDDELTHLDESIARLDRAIYDNRLAVNSTPRINAPGVRTRNSHGVETDTGRNDRTSRRPGRRPSAARMRDDLYNKSMERGPDARSGRRLGLSPVQEPTIHYTHPPHRSNAGDQDVARSKLCMKPATYDGTGLWNDYLSHFESVSLLNHWTETEKGLYLAASLRCQALGILGNQPRDDRQNYTRLVQSLQDRFAPSNQTELYRSQLRERRQKASESLPEMGQDVRRLTNLAYPTASSDLKEILAIEQFLDGLYDSEMRLKIKQARPSSLNDAIQRAVELEAFNRAEKRRTETVRWMEHKSSARSPKLEKLIEAMQKSISTLAREVRDLKRSKGQGNQIMTEAPKRKVENRSGEPRVRLRRCYKCGSTEHLRRDCPRIQRNQHVDKAVETRPHCSRDDESADDTELYVSMLVNGMPTRFLVDTGATVSLLSRTAYDRMDKAHETSTGVDGEVVSTNGTLVKVLGQTSVQLKIADEALTQDLIIADIHEDGILGMDFLLKHKCIINLQTRAISIPGMEPIKVEKTTGNHMLVMVRRVNMQPVSEAPADWTGDEGLSAEIGKDKPKTRYHSSKFLRNFADINDETQESLTLQKLTQPYFAVPRVLKTCTKFVAGNDQNASTCLLRSKDQDRQIVHRLETISGTDTGIEHRAENLYGSEYGPNRKPCGTRRFHGNWQKSTYSAWHIRAVDIKTSDEPGQSAEVRMGNTQDQNRSKSMNKSDDLGTIGNGMSCRIESV